jgi:hypothetical protein
MTSKPKLWSNIRPFRAILPGTSNFGKFFVRYLPFLEPMVIPSTNSISTKLKLWSNIRPFRAILPGTFNLDIFFVRYLPFLCSAVGGDFRLQRAGLCGVVIS